MQGSEKLSTRHTHRHTVEVSGQGPFPLDMLRYESAFPTDESDSHLIQNTLNPMISGELARWKVRVSKFSDAKPNWCLSRWESFHCELEAVDRFKDR